VLTGSSQGGSQSSSQGWAEPGRTCGRQGGAAHQTKPMMSGSRIGRTQGTAMTTNRIAPAGSIG